jgi:hypothetical protein
MHWVERFRQRLGPARDHHPMHVVRHQAVTHHRHALRMHRLTEQIQINPPLRVAGQNELPTTSPISRRSSDHRRAEEECLAAYVPQRSPVSTSLPISLR